MENPDKKANISRTFHDACLTLEREASITAKKKKKKMKSSIKDFFGKFDQIRRKLWIWS